MTHLEKKYLFLIIAIFIAACIETDIYLPAFPDMMAYFSVTEQEIQSLLTWNFLGLVISGPFYGPLSDSFGRKKPLLFALSLFLLGSVVTVLSDGFQAVLVGRLLQGLGSGGVFTLGTAILFDAFHEKRAAQAMSQINSIVPFIIAGAPVAGGFLNHTFGFRSNFLAIALLVSMSLSICFFFFDETLALEKRAVLSLAKIAGDFGRVFRCGAFWKMAMVICLPFAGYMAFLSTCSVLYVLELGVSKANFPFYQALILIGWLIASLTCGRFTRILGLQKVKTIGLTVVTASVVGSVLSALFFPVSAIMHTIPVAVYGFGFNWVQTPYCIELMELIPDIKGISASVLTSTRLLVTAGMVGLTSHFYNKQIYPITITQVVILVIILPLALSYERKRNAQAKLT